MQQIDSEKQGRDEFGLIKCANCGMVQTSNPNGICSCCLRDYKDYGTFYNFVNCKFDIDAKYDMVKK